MTEKIDTYENRILDNKKELRDDDDISFDELMDDLDDENIFSKYREQRMQEISDHLKTVKKNVNDNGYGDLIEVKNESELIKMSTNVPKIIIHFGLDTFAKCRYMDDKLKQLSRKYLNTKFVKVSVTLCPFLVEKLQIKTLPFVVGYIKGLEAGRLIGFSKLGNDPNGFPIENLEKFFLSTRVIESFSGTTIKQDARKIGSSGRYQRTADDEDASDSSLDI
ncbi:Plp1p NDAI_0B05460 [Naumovozyma dairenensis CBS 421]|uniref:Phosducin domain-containing protein n=1 Tax=Naumovozyma dairenensis (strain ATCC 10597 / BCRC 20456 / CBS 421 / NBRC 0211 / NRRL Y-12639) TaxID=1071378 RepID=G0W718_NAUDC|nr:hypothetical protein NDAI_0B05460 [Naumovozyma dairenensis CBS 421]CCD23579.1 hypothetical protein NDAI_0B05460 [Naumovozyma dairenensis CBS 421]